MPLIQLLPLLVFIAGACAGSFLNVVILRYITAVTDQQPNMRLGGRSRCPQCSGQLRWWELVPILSFILLRGRCHRCRTQISIQYPAVELSTGLVFVVLANQLPVTVIGVLELILLLLIAAILIVLFVIDLYTMLLPDIFVALLTVLAVVVVIVRITNYELQITDSLLGIAVGAGFLGLLWLITRGRGIGLGDVKLMIPLGLLFGLVGAITLLFIAFTSGGLVGSAMLFSRRAQLKTAIPFGPFLCGAALLLLLLPQLPHVLQTFIFGVVVF